MNQRLPAAVPVPFLLYQAAFGVATSLKGSCEFTYHSLLQGIFVPWFGQHPYQPSLSPSRAASFPVTPDKHAVLTDT